MKTAMKTIPLTIIVAILLMGFCATGCALIKLKDDVNQSLESTVIVGRIYAEVSGKGPIIVAACPMNERKTIAHYTVLHGPGEYELMVDQGDYYVFAYRDKNSNLIYEAGEPAGQYSDPDGVRAPAVGVVFDIDIAIPEGGEKIEMPLGSTISSVQPLNLYSRQAGVLAGLDDERFAENYGRKGFWAPMTFFKEMGGNIFFLEEYDREKIPILFIHGAGGTPKGWRYFVDHIDRSRFQPWFFYYPTGARMESMAYLLLWKLSNLQTRYQFNKMVITAHSMGGLIARSFIVNYSAQFPYVDLFISLATPWGGDRMAEYGVQQSPAVIPSWIDMQPESDFIKSIYRAELPETVSFYMFYGHKGNRNPLRSNNDGTITLSSLLDYRAQSEAKMNYAFDEDHGSLIYSKDVLAQYNAIMEAFYEKESASLRKSGGYVKVHFSHGYDSGTVKPSRALIIRPRDKKAGETITLLKDSDNGRILGPFPPGRYVASMVTMAARTKQQYIHVSINSRETKELNFVFTPDGVIRGCLAGEFHRDDTFVGRPDYRYRSIDAEIHIQSITLDGAGVHRRLQPIEGGEINSFAPLILRKDFCFNQCFGFFGLSAGDYELTIQADGYQPIVKNYTVKPGIPTYFRATELFPE